VRGCTVFDETLAPRRIVLPPLTEPQPVPVSSVRLDQSIVATIDELERALAATEFRSSLVAELRETYAPGIGMVEAFGRWLERLLGPSGLVVFDSSDPAAKPLVGELFARELRERETGRHAADAGADLIASGYHTQVQPREDAPSLFHLDGSRRPIRVEDGRLVAGEERYPATELARVAVEQPVRFSPNVLLRPLVQDTIFPTVCYVAGPNELGYLAQLRRVYEHFGIPMPLIYPRATATLVDSAALRFLTRNHVALEALQPRDEATLNELLLTQLPPAIDEAFTSASRVIEAQMHRLVEAMPALDPTLEGAARSTLAKMRHDLDTLHGKMIQAAKRRDETLRRQFVRARALTFPDGLPQERAIGFVSFLNQYGPALVDRLLEALPIDFGRHWVIAL
jgi:bacillithiol biosynthesis cysteine-adding enzyme BshC